MCLQPSLAVTYHSFGMPFILLFMSLLPYVTFDTFVMCKFIGVLNPFTTNASRVDTFVMCKFIGVLNLNGIYHSQKTLSLCVNLQGSKTSKHITTHNVYTDFNVQSLYLAESEANAVKLRFTATISVWGCKVTPYSFNSPLGNFYYLKHDRQFSSAALE